MFRRTTLLLFTFVLVAVVACSKKDKAAPPSTGSAASSAATGSGSAMGSDSGSAGSAMAGSDAGSAAGSAGSADAGSAAAGSAAAGSGSAAAGSGAETEFDKLSHDDKVKFMKTKVMPVMKAAFQKFDPKEFAKFTCKTCHGKDPTKSKYEMPTPDLPKLDFDALKKGDEKEFVEFMEKVVKPEMAKILGEHEMTQAEPTGFGCLSCHMEKKK